MAPESSTLHPPPSTRHPGEARNLTRRPRVLLLSGTGEGPVLARALLDAGYAVEATVTRDEARSNLFGPLADAPGFTVEAHRFTAATLADRLARIDVVVDATHPFAVRITELARSACADLGVPYIRFERPDWEPPAGVEVVASFAEAADRLAALGGVAILTVGANPLPQFAHLHQALPMFARVLPSPASIQQALDAGFPPARILGLRPPFSRAFNRALFAHCGATVLVTKASGPAGGVVEKVAAARDRKMRVLMIGRPTPPDPTHATTAAEVLAKMRVSGFARVEGGGWRVEG